MRFFTAPWLERLVWLGLGAVLAGGLLFFLRPNWTTQAVEKQAATEPGTPSPEEATRTGTPAVDGEPECYLGVVLTRDAVDVASEMDGLLEDVRVRVGDRVTREAVIARLDTAVLRQQLELERASLQRVVAQQRRQEIAARQARKEHERRTALNEAGLLSSEEAESARFQREKAAADLEAAKAEAAQVEAQIRQLEITLARAEIRAPFAGTVAQRYLDPGSRVGPGMPVVRLISTGNLLARFAVPPEATEVPVDSAVRVEVETLGRAFRGVVRQRAPEIDAASQMVFVEARLEVTDAEATLIPSGAVARISSESADTPSRSCLD